MQLFIKYVLICSREEMNEIIKLITSPDTIRAVEETIRAGKNV